MRCWSINLTLINLFLKHGEEYLMFSTTHFYSNSNSNSEVGLGEEDARNRNRWKRLTQAADPAIQWD